MSVVTSCVMTAGPVKGQNFLSKKPEGKMSWVKKAGAKRPGQKYQGA